MSNKLTDDYLKEKVKVLLNIDDTTLYDERLKISIGAAMNKLENEGVKNIYAEGSNPGFEYTLCVAYLVAQDLDMVADYNRLLTQYMTRVVTLREQQRYDSKS